MFGPECAGAPALLIPPAPPGVERDGRGAMWLFPYWAYSGTESMYTAAVARSTWRVFREPVTSSVVPDSRARCRKIHPHDKSENAQGYEREDDCGGLLPV